MGHAMTQRLNQIRPISVSSTRNAVADLTGLMASSELITGTPTVSCTGLTFTNVAFNTEAIEEQGRSVAVGKAVKFTVTGVVLGTRYDILVTAATDAGQTLPVICPAMGV